MPPPDPATALERLRGTARDLVSLTAAVSAERLRRCPPAEPDDEEPWSPAMVLSHLADAEMVYGVRLRAVLADPRPYLAVYDEREWVRRFGHLDDDPRTVLARWRVLRDANLRVLDSLEEDEWRRTGVHPQRGQLSVAAIVAGLADHDREHLDQIRSALAS